MNQSQADKLDLEALRAYPRMIHGQLTPEEFAALEHRLLNDPEFRQAYVEQVDMETQLEARLGSLPRSTCSPIVSAEPAASLKTHRPYWLALAICVLLLIGLGSVTLTGLPWRSAGPHVEYVEARLSGLKPVAIVTHIKANQRGKATPLTRGSRLKPGVISLSDGELQLEFLSGVFLRLYGPAEIHLLADDAATLVRGQVAVVASPDTRSFSLNGPISAIVAGPVEFTYQLGTVDSGRIDVYQGEVMASLLGTNGDTLLNELIHSNQSAVFEGSTLEVEAPQFAEADRSRLLPIDEQSLESNAAYVAMIEADNPLVYWRFFAQDASNNLIRNQMSDRYAARIHGGEDGSLRLERGALNFHQSDSSRFVRLDEPIERLNEGDFTIEFWVRPQRMHWGTIFGLLPVQQADPDRESHLCVLEYANQTNLVHRPATIRFLYRYPPTTYGGGVNVFSAESCVPGIWNHVVAVKTSESIQLYFNGEPRFVMDNLTLDDDHPYTALLGQLDGVRRERQFEGQVAEVAIYRKALADDDIQRHYRAMMGDRTL